MAKEVKETTIHPLGKRVLVKPHELKETTESGIIVGSNAINPSYLIGEVVEVNKEVKSVKKGDLVAHLKYGMEEMKTKDGVLNLVEESSLIAVYE